MSLIQEFKEFAVKGNVVDMAVGVIIGGAFGKIVSSVVTDVIMPPIGLLLNGVDFKDLSYVLKEKVGEAPAVVIRYGTFIQTVIDFLIIAAAVFIMVKVILKLKKSVEAKKATEPAPAPAPAAPTKEEILLTEIRDLLKEKR